MIDTWMSRRDHFIKCRYWCVDDDDIVPTDRVVHNNYPSGIFYAKEISPKSEENQIVESAFMVKKKSAILFTTYSAFIVLFLKPPFFIVSEITKT